MKRLSKLLILIILLLPINKVLASERHEVSLVKCVDGDTALFNISGEEKKFRFLGIDTPESVHPNKDVESGGKEASEYTCNLLTNAKKIEVLYDPKSSKTDKYNRELAWIYIDNELLQENLVKNGYAEVAYIYGKYMYVDDLCGLQASAIENKMGIWEDGKRKEGYCKTKSNKKESTTKTRKTTKKSKKDEDIVIDDPVIIELITVVVVIYFILKKLKVIK